mmetsp:Transcript_56840/g.163172  ORF Transcript_56840/g.163172 Transcript_56840/m.163172 type:complete len:292 (-) Transcript_56840:302-1177(-)
MACPARGGGGGPAACAVSRTTCSVSSNLFLICSKMPSQPSASLACTILSPCNTAFHCAWPSPHCLFQESTAPPLDTPRTSRARSCITRSTSRPSATPSALRSVILNMTNPPVPVALPKCCWIGMTWVAMASAWDIGCDDGCTDEGPGGTGRADVWGCGCNCCCPSCCLAKEPFPADLPATDLPAADLPADLPAFPPLHPARGPPKRPAAVPATEGGGPANCSGAHSATVGSSPPIGVALSQVQVGRLGTGAGSKCSRGPCSRSGVPGKYVVGCMIGETATSDQRMPPMVST